MKILLLGGISEAKQLAATLHDNGHQVIYSIAGLVRQPTLPCEIISGGFSQYFKQSSRPSENAVTQNKIPALPKGVQGLCQYLAAENIQLLIDATHPYASQMSEHAVIASRHNTLPCWQYIRPAWEPSPSVPFQQVKDWTALKAQLNHYQRPLFTIGQQPLLDPCISYGQQWLVRTAVATNNSHPKITLISEIGPFSEANEEKMLDAHTPDLLVSKNSGGKSMYRKLVAASKRNIPIILLQRPTKTKSDKIFSCTNDLLTALGVTQSL